MFSLTIVLHALHRFGSPVLAGWLSFAAIAPGLILSPVAGAILDRVGSVRAVAADMVASATLIAALLCAAWLQLETPLILLVLVGLFSLTSPLGAAGVRTALPRMVPVEALDRVNAIDTAIFAFADVSGPVLAGITVGLAGSGTAFAAITMLYAAAAVSLSGTGGHGHNSAQDVGLLRQAMAGIKTVLRHPTLRGLAIAYTLYQVAWGVMTIAIPVALLRALPAEAANLGTGLLWAGAGLAGAVGALTMGHLRTAGRERLIMIAGMSLVAVAAWPIAATGGVMGIGLGLILAGGVGGAIDVAVLTLRQRRTDPAQLGRVLSVSISLNIAGFPLGAAVGGMLVETSLALTFAAAALAAALGAAAVRLIPGGAG
jgi:hypothetical protein